MDALADDPFYTTLANAASDDPEMSRDMMHRYLDYSLVEAARFGVVCFPADRRQGAAALSRPLDDSLARQKSREKKGFIERHMGTHCLAVYEDITDHMRNETKEWVPEHCWYLSIIDELAQAGGVGLVSIEGMAWSEIDFLRDLPIAEEKVARFAVAAEAPAIATSAM